MASIGWVLVFVLSQLLTLLCTSSANHADGGNQTHLPVPFFCHPDQAKALLQLKKSFFVGSTTRLLSWQDGSDCCLWEAVGCDASSGRVTVLDLSNCGLSSPSLNSAVFNLTSLQFLDLSMNNFGGDSELQSEIPSTGFERLTLLTHLNLSNSGFSGQIPIGISKLVNLVSLDLSNRYFDSYYGFDDPNSYYSHNDLQGSTFGTLVENLGRLRELYLDGVSWFDNGEEWCTSLAASSPRLQVLSLANCGLTGPIHKSLSRLHFLTAINLQGNNGLTAGPFPEFFMDFLNLTILQLSGVNLEGWFPSRSFQSKNLRVLDLSSNQNLSGHFPNFSNVSALETLRLAWTNFSYTRPMPSSNFKSLKELTLDGSLSMDFLYSFGRLRSLFQLNLNLDSVTELEPVFSWIGHENLVSLALYGCNFSETTATSLSNFKTLRRLGMVYCNLPRLVLHAVGNLIGLQKLEMQSCTTYGSMPSSIGNLKNLRDLYISDCWFSGPMPDAIGKLTNLRNMYMESCMFSGPMPTAIGELKNLRNMYLIDCLFSGPIPVAVGNLTNLKAMYIHGCQFSWSSIPYAIGQLSQLTVLALSFCNFSGSIPSSVGNLTELTMLDLSENSLSGEIPSSIVSLPALRILDLSFNQLSGPLQGFDKASSQLELVYLRYNAFSGFFPEAFFQLKSLVYIDVRSNNLTGSVDLSQFWKLSELASLHLSYNGLHVMDADGNNPLATYLNGLHGLGLATCNITQFPSFLRRLNYISYLDLSSNKISGDVPNWIWETWGGRLTYLNLSHNLLTGMQLTTDVLPFTSHLEVFDLSSNGLTGQIPMPNSSGQILEYSNNRFSSLLPNWTSYLWGTTYLSISKNHINGHLPPSICNATQLDVLDISDNNFSGPIPSCLIENVPLKVLNLRENHFEGILPSNITTSCSLQTIDLHGNKIEGQIPRGLSNCSNLEVLDFGGNRIVDTFPSWLSGLPMLSVLVLRSNQLYGTISDIVEDTKSGESFPSLQIIDLASNNLSGNLRPQWIKQLKSMMAEFNSSGKTLSTLNTAYAAEFFYQYYIEIMYKGIDTTFERMLTTVKAIDFSNNRLEGTIPETFGSLVSLRVLSLSHNAFTGNIPSQLGSMTDLESLDLSCNQLSGEIPEELTNLTFLGSLNLSNNHLVGQIPQSRQFSTFDSSSFGGNAGLCGLQLPESPCGGSPHAPSVAHVNKSSRHVDVILFLFVGLGFGVGFAATVVVKWGQISRRFAATARASRT